MRHRGNAPVSINFTRFDGLTASPSGLNNTLSYLSTKISALQAFHESSGKAGVKFQQNNIYRCAAP